ncbi:poly(A) RNA polymerase, mitochondrial-like isoform X2 [Ostrea edulis]|uniref:poly(A) RNA polymerase, mitochondrial-like isoform X2 n=1 Tax=Ostrea edulis TaxID=37623 RepID=UPI0020950761|nr:poly(A) RNA polymerase, mitochondrial-like isoform X2 [Ostrea edulis]XP_048727950.1 poly(A) RNA polymerase, mitochondrial-like isoform X2 [Ostrea edulis]XP_055997395.1 poly(A) RNA polymerase, mitochondrial-like isoform X2 [Ostrea edulis]XP_055997396.1 poly(A) RNA polymerase, mitochondrial-like isoform X2 [Ostrea edulis]
MTITNDDRENTVNTQQAAQTGTESQTLKVWIQDSRGQWIKTDLPSSDISNHAPNDRVQLNLTDRLQSNQIWSIPNIYQSKEILTLASEAKRSILIQCKQGKTYMQHFLAVCEGWGAVSRIVIINRSTALVTYENESDVAKITSGVYNESKSEKINQLEKRIFRFAKQRKAAESNLECENVTALSHSNLHEKLMNKKLGEQMRELGDRVKQTDDRKRVWFFVLQCIQDILDLSHPDHRALPFGSVVNGFASENSDLDIVITKEGNLGRSDGKPVLQNMQRALRQLQTYTINSILRARVPIVKFNHTLTGVCGDISYGNCSGIKASVYLNAISQFSPSVVPFIMTVKLWSIHYMDWFPQKFVFTALALFYLQQCRVIPPIGSLKIENDSSCDFKKWTCDVVLSPEELLHGYFKFYKCFDFHNKDICLDTGEIIPKRGYFENLITNPFSDGENAYEDIISRLPEDKMLYIQTCMGESLRVLNESPDSLILGNRSYQ